MSNIIFLSGALRSGTTMLHLILDHHPSLMNPGEFDFLFDYLGENGNEPSISAYHQHLSLDRIFLAKNLNLNPDLNYHEQIIDFTQQLQVENKLLILNIHRNFHHALHYFPDAKFIHLVRDPRDVARSSIGMGWAGNVYYGVDHWIKTEESWNQINTRLKNEQFIELRYEDVVLSPNLQLKKLCNFLDVDFSNKMLEYNSSSTYEAPDPSLTFQWKKKQSIREVELVEYKTKPLILQYNYELLHPEPRSASPIEKTMLTLKNKLSKVSFSINRYGINLYLLNQLSRRLRIMTIQKRCQKKMNGIDKNHVR